MAKQRVGRRPRRHYGVKILTLADGRHVARFVDPATGKQGQQSLDKLKLTNDDDRRAWAVEKSNALAEMRRAASLGAKEVVRISPKDAKAQYMESIAHAATRASKETPLRALVERLEGAGILQLSELTGPALIREWRDWVTSPARTHSPVTRNHWLRVGARFMRWARKRGMVPFISLEAIKDATERVPEPEREIQFLVPGELKRLLQAAIAHDKADPHRRRVAPWVMTLVLSGCRLREASDLRWGEVQADGLKLTPGRIKTRKGRLVTFAESPTLRDLIEALRPKNAKPDARVFPDWGVAPWENARVRLVLYYGAPRAWSAHTLRRSCECVLVNASSIHGAASIWHAARRAGHSVEQSERDYSARLTGLPASATCIEDAADIRAECEAIVRAAKGSQ